MTNTPQKIRTARLTLLIFSLIAVACLVRGMGITHTGRRESDHHYGDQIKKTYVPHAISSAAQRNRTSHKSSSKDVARAAALFTQNCARCHGADGRGETALGKSLETPNFADAEWWEKHRSDKRLVASITHGHGSMPAFGKKLSREDITALAAYVRRFNR